MRIKTSEPKAMLAFLAIAALLFCWAFSGLASGAGSTMAAIERVAIHKSDADEAPEDRRRRMREIAVAIDGSTPSLDERAWLIMTARRESGLAAYVTEDHPRCSEGRGGVCDGGAAFGPWQLHGTKRDLDLSEQARVAINRFRGSANYCRARGVEHWLGGTSAYATGWRCDWAEAAERVAEMRTVRGRL